MCVRQGGRQSFDGWQLSLRWCRWRSDRQCVRVVQTWPGLAMDLGRQLPGWQPTAGGCQTSLLHAERLHTSKLNPERQLKAVTGAFRLADLIAV